jgi:hypothetical protein
LEGGEESEVQTAQGTEIIAKNSRGNYRFVCSFRDKQRPMVNPEDCIRADIQAIYWRKGSKSVSPRAE